MITWVPALILGMVSSVHCLGMCGPIALALPLNRTSHWQMFRGIAINNASRITGYGLLGTAAGIAGQGLRVACYQQQLSIISGVIMLAFSLLLFKPALLNRMTHRFKSGTFFRKTFARYLGKSSLFALGAIGLMNAFLPCGFVYIALAGALGTGDVLSGATYMMLFGLGTAPMLIGVAFAGNWFTNLTLRNAIRKFTPGFVLVLSCLLILRGSGLDIPFISPLIGDTGVQACCSK